MKKKLCSGKGHLGYDWIQLIFAETENWKHCSKIVFKYVNSAWDSWTVNSCNVTVHALGKKKCKRENVPRIQTLI